MITVYKGRSPEMKVGLMSPAMGRRDRKGGGGGAEEEEGDEEDERGWEEDMLSRKTKKGKNEYKTGGGESGRRVDELGGAR